MLAVSRRHLYDLLETRALRSFTSGRRRLIRVTELERYVQEREAAA
jgi:excisionase family DNA binding protein